MGPISGEWSLASCCLFLCWKYTLEQQFSSAATGHFKGWLLCESPVSLPSCVLALSLSRLRQGEPLAAERARPVQRGPLAVPFAGRAGPAPLPGIVRVWVRQHLSSPSPRVEGRCQLSATCLVPAWSLLGPLFSLSPGCCSMFFSALPDETQRVEPWARSAYDKGS